MIYRKEVDCDTAVWLLYPSEERHTPYKRSALTLLVEDTSREGIRRLVEEEGLADFALRHDIILAVPVAPREGWLPTAANLERLARIHGGITKPENKPDLDDLRKKLFTKKSKNDLEYFTNLLALRDGVMADGQPDPFLPINREFRATAQDEADAERIATQIKEAIEYADGDPAVFSNDLRRRCGMSRR